MVLVVAFTSCSCQDDPPAPAEPALPPITQTGENTFGCFFNGDIWLPQGGGMQIILSADYYNSSLYIEATNNLNRQMIHFGFGKVYGDTSFPISNYFSAQNFQDFYVRTWDEPFTHYSQFNAVTNSGQITVNKLDTVNRIVAGTFSFDVLDTITGGNITIREGRFDLRY